MQKASKEEKKYKSYMESPIGELTIVTDGTAVLEICFGHKEAAISKMEECVLNQQAKEQLLEYFQGKRQEFTLPLAPKGTAFQKRVWQALLQIPYGETRSYGQIATAVGNPKASRAVGMASHKNPIPVIVPCHRVVGANGKLTGYAGGLDVKHKLLRIERKDV